MVSEPRASLLAKKRRSERDEKLIKAVRNYPCIWDNRDKSHKEQRTRENAWIEVTKVVNQDIDQKDPVFSIDNCQKKWKSHRDRLVRERKKVTAYKSGDPGPPYKPSWDLYDLLLFLTDTVKHRQCQGNMDDGDDSVDDHSESVTEASDSRPETSLDHEDSLSERSLSSTHKPKKRKVESDLDEVIYDRLKKIDERRDIREQSRKEMDDEDHFACTVAFHFVVCPLISVHSVRYRYNN